MPDDELTWHAMLLLEPPLRSGDPPLAGHSGVHFTALAARSSPPLHLQLFLLHGPYSNASTRWDCTAVKRDQPTYGVLAKCARSQSIDLLLASSWGG